MIIDIGNYNRRHDSVTAGIYIYRSIGSLYMLWGILFSKKWYFDKIKRKQKAWSFFHGKCNPGLLEQKKSNPTLDNSSERVPAMSSSLSE